MSYRIDKEDMCFFLADTLASARRCGKALAKETDRLIILRNPRGKVLKVWGTEERLEQYKHEKRVATEKASALFYEACILRVS